MSVFNLGPLGLPPEKVIPEILLSIGGEDYSINSNSSYYTSGKFKFAIQRDETTKVYNWELAILSSGTITFKKSSRAIDIFLVGGGKPGSDGYHVESTGYHHGGNGGQGGACITREGFTINKNTSYQLVIGASDQNTTGFGYTAITGGGSLGGTGAVCYQSGNGVGNNSVAIDGEDGVEAFGDSTNTLLGSGYQNYKYGAGGGGGGAKQGQSPYYEPKQSNGTIRSAAYGGNDGGGAGGAPDEDNAGDAGVSNSGSGGGGGAFYKWEGSGGAGGSGIIIIRNAR